MADTIIHKIGDSISWSLNYKQSNNSPVDLTNYTININAINRSNVEAFNVSSDSPTSNQYIDISDVANGNFKFIIKDTSLFRRGDYYVDIEYTDLVGYKKSSKSFNLRLVERL